jgi:hypothetical protein
MASHTFSAGAAIGAATATGHLKPGFGSSTSATGWAVKGLGPTGTDLPSLFGEQPLGELDALLEVSNLFQMPMLQLTHPIFQTIDQRNSASAAVRNIRIPPTAILPMMSTAGHQRRFADALTALGGTRGVPSPTG